MQGPGGLLRHHAGLASTTLAPTVWLSVASTFHAGESAGSIPQRGKLHAHALGAGKRLHYHKPSQKPIDLKVPALVE